MSVLGKGGVVLMVFMTGKGERCVGGCDWGKGERWSETMVSQT